MRHCRRSEAIQSGIRAVAAALDCFVAALLAMTNLTVAFGSAEMSGA
jgi:hypothetical protein